MTKAQMIEAIMNTYNDEMKKNYGAWLKRQNKETLEEVLKQRTNTKEDKNMMKADGSIKATQFEFDGVKYTETRPNYYYKNEDGKQKRIGKAEYEQAFENYIDMRADEYGDAEDDWDAEQEIADREAKQAYKDAETEKNFNKKKSASKPRRSKDVAFIFTPNGDESKQLTLTKKQVDFLKALPQDDFWQDGIDSGLWCDCIADSIGWNPMSVGAMISTLREKDIVFTTVERVNGKKCKGMMFTDLGKIVATELGLE